ncbi:hypothetical protein chiPu_0003885 [Chiloscyllium punctatum]|uniref:Uncharacterized protein n=1 Tax=Chiloscyllium punctatum TaxID=137246 RepID=A0A401S504_CHIPU|nr:hypothetical protein [Chiloscyllium punctatum]
MVWEGPATEDDIPQEGLDLVLGTGDDVESISSKVFDSQVPPTELVLIPFEELWEFVEETRSRRDRAQLALNRWSSFELVYWSAQTELLAKHLDWTLTKVCPEFPGYTPAEGHLRPSLVLPVNVYSFSCIGDGCLVPLT